MSDHNQFNYIEQSSLDTDSALDLRKIYYYLSNWYWFLLAILISISCAILYGHYSLPEYRVTATLLIEEDDNIPTMGNDRFMKGFGLDPGLQNLDNQVFILSSWSLVERALEELDFQREYYYRGKVNKKSLYKKSPIIVELDSLSPIPYDLEFTITPLGEESFRLVVEDNDWFEFDMELTFNELVMGDMMGFRILKSPEYWSRRINDKEIYFAFHRSNKIIVDYQERLVVEPANPEGSIVELILEGTNWQMDRDFLIKLTEVFIRNNLDKKNKEAQRTVAFINKQLEGVSDSLIFTENRLEKFRSRNRVMNISEQGNQIIEQGVKLENEKAALIIQRNYFDYLEGYLSNNDVSDDIIAPASIGISDPNIISLIGQLSEMQTEYYKYSLGSSDNSPLQSNLLLQIRNTKRTLLEALRSISLQNKIAINDINKRLAELNRQAVSLPVTERELLGIEREFNLNDALYTFLLERQAEAQIQMASNTANNEVIDYPRVHDEPVSPKKELNYVIAIVIGLFIPFIILFIKGTLNNKIDSEDDLRKITSIPIAAHLPHSDLRSQVVLLKDPNSNISEAFRSFRTRLKFLTKNIDSPIILVTSSIPNEGKTFTALNLAFAHSVSGSKTVLVEFDLRKPKFAEKLNYPDTKLGISSYLSGKNNIEEIIKSAGYKHLDIIPAGQVPPNPAELTSSNRVQVLLTELKNRYEHIILDSAPIGTVSDAYALSLLSDITILVVRHNQTEKRDLEATLSNMKLNGVNDLNLLLNDLPPPNGLSGYSYRYGNYSRYGYQ